MSRCSRWFKVNERTRINQISPKKNFAVPEELRLFFRSKTNRRAGKLFMLFTFRDDLHRKCMEKLSKDDLFKSFVCFAARTNKDIFAALIITHTDHRLIDIKKTHNSATQKQNGDKNLHKN